MRGKLLMGMMSQGTAIEDGRYFAPRTRVVWMSMLAA
jgi:hypothetical protein